MWFHSNFIFNKPYAWIAALLLFCSLGANAQNFDYGSSWYTSRSSQPLVRLVVEEDGIYRVSFQDLQNAGFDLTGVNARNLHVIYRGEEQPIYVSQTSTGQLNFLEFFGQKNDGWLDSVMYRDPLSGLADDSHQPNKNYSLFTDESVYFLTWDNLPGQRIFNLFDPTYGRFTAMPHFSYESRVDYVNAHSFGGGGQYDIDYLLNSDFVTGEGYVGPAFGYGENVKLNLPTPTPANTTQDITVKARVFGISNTDHRLRITMNGDESNLLIDTTRFIPAPRRGVYIKTYQRDIDLTLGAVTELNFEALRATTDNNRVCWASITYDRLPDLQGDSMLSIANWNQSTTSYLELSNTNGNDTLFAYDLANRVRNVGLIQNGRGRVIIQGFPNQRPLFIGTDKAIKRPRIEAASANRAFEREAEYVIITHRSLQASAEAYAQYRDTASRTPIGSVSVIFVDEIYDEFGYGSLTPWAIKRFCKYALDNWSTQPRYFLLWGKGIANGVNVSFRNTTDLPVVPAYGYPATDYEYVGHFEPNSIGLDLEAAIGRVNVRNNTQGQIYLDKVKSYESTEWEPWMKESVFLGGGQNLGEQRQIQEAFEFALEIFESLPFGGFPYYFQKNSESVIIDFNDATYHDRISEGVNLIHFFGHSSRNILDVNIRSAQEYTNFGRFPLMVAMGCYGGDFTERSSTFGETWIAAEDRGAIGYLANSSAGYLGPLREYAKILYAYLFRERLNEPLGPVITSTINFLLDSAQTRESQANLRNHARQVNLQGDPALIMHAPKLPDLSIDETSVFFEPAVVTAQDDSFTLNLIIDNTGLVTEDSFLVTINQRVPDGRNFEQVRTYLPMIPYRDTIRFTLRNPVGNLMTGQNTFDIFVDANERLTEYDESNNRLASRQLIPGNIPAILFPAEYAVIPDNEVTLKASAFFMTRETGVRYIFEVDTSARFDSPLKQASGIVVGNANLVEWEVPQTLIDSAVYFWRVRLADISPSNWSTSSFRYIANRKGWAQANFDQFNKARLIEMGRDETQRKWDFGSYGVEFDFKVKGNRDFVYFRNGDYISDVNLFGFFGDYVCVIIIDQYTLQPISLHPSGMRLQIFRTPTEVYQLAQLIQNVKPGDYVLLASHNNPRIDTWDETVFQSLRQIGASDDIRYLAANNPFLILGRKGFNTGAAEVFTPNTGAGEYQIIETLTANFESGSMRSTQIGPAKSWEELIWDWNTVDPTREEMARVNVYGIRRDGSDSLLLSDLEAGTYSLSAIDAARFPMLALVSNMSDSIRRTAPQMDHWQVLYDPVPDAVVDPILDFSFQSDTVYEGEDIYLRMGAFNISDIDMDSINAVVTLEREDRSRLVIDTLRLAPLLANGPSTKFETSFASTNKELSGRVNLIVEINPEQDPIEQHVFNNLYIQPFFVVVDDQNPVLDVTFDGKHILDGDIVSPRPEILVEVNDENQFVALSDSNTFQLYFSQGRNNILDTGRVFITTDDRVEWQPAQLPENKARLYFRPGKSEPLADGEYNLRVQGQDKKGNQAGGGPDFFEITFRVENQSTLTEVLNYPNPFSASTRFVYTLTGAEMPETFQIHIYTISGKMVKMIDLKALGDVHFGHN
ncbi:MAG: C25 family cysteine peptidase, partial [Bacteroidota bacterium]